jgi:hypothetical protein
MGMVFPVAIVAVVIVLAVAAVAFIRASSPGANSGQAFEAISGSKAVTLLEAERQELIDMNAAAHTLTVSVHPKVVSPSQVLAAAAAAAQQATQDNNQASGGGPPPGPAPNPGSAEAIGYAMLPSFGFSQKTQWGCLYHLWMRESGWSYDAENASGAYGIPQALPGSKMAVDGSDWRTDPRTQIKWGLGYITSSYGTPCGAWDHEVNDGWY